MFCARKQRTKFSTWRHIYDSIRQYGEYSWFTSTIDDGNNTEAGDTFLLFSITRCSKFHVLLAIVYCRGCPCDDDGRWRWTGARIHILLSSHRALFTCKYLIEPKRGRVNEWRRQQRSKKKIESHEKCRSVDGNNSVRKMKACYLWCDKSRYLCAPERWCRIKKENEYITRVDRTW